MSLLHFKMEAGLEGLKFSQASTFQFLPFTVIPMCFIIRPERGPAAGLGHEVRNMLINSCDQRKVIIR